MNRIRIAPRGTPIIPLNFLNPETLRVMDHNGPVSGISYISMEPISADQLSPTTIEICMLTPSGEIVTSTHFVKSFNVQLYPKHSETRHMIGSNNFEGTTKEKRGIKVQLRKNTTKKQSHRKLRIKKTINAISDLEI